MLKLKNWIGKDIVIDYMTIGLSNQTTNYPLPLIFSKASWITNRKLSTWMGFDM